MENKIVLASASPARAAMLRNAGVLFEAAPARIDEDTITAALLAENASARDIADALAETKARRCSSKFPSRLVLGADQVLVCEGRLINKAAGRNAALDILKRLRGKDHELFSAAVICDAGQPVWRKIGAAKLSMRNFSDSFLHGYIDRCEDDILASVGCYNLEGEGAQLFDRVEGDFFTILGLPLIEVLDFLRTRGILAR